MSRGVLSRGGGTGSRAETRRLVLEKRAEGLSQPATARQLGLSLSYVRDLLHDPEGVKAKERKDSYRLPCPKCGRLMTGCNGIPGAPEQCRFCDVDERKQNRYWTRTRVIEAIQRFAEKNGRPPIAEEWLHVGASNGFPARSQVYGRNKNQPFKRWADAIEAAGFARPGHGRRTLNEGGMMTRAGYTILRECEDGRWEVVGHDEAPSQITALNNALNGSEPKGRWVAVPGRYWRPRTLQPKTVFDWAEDEVPA